MKKFFIIIMALAIMAAAVLVVGYFCFYRLSTQPVTVQNIEFVGCLEKRGSIHWDDWFIVNDQQKRSEIDSDILAKLCDTKDFEMDFDKYTYIFVDGREMVKLSYIPNDCRNRLSGSPSYYGYAVLKKAEDKLYAYRIPSDLPVIKDIHAHYGTDFRTTILD